MTIDELLVALISGFGICEADIGLLYRKSTPGEFYVVPAESQESYKKITALVGKEGPLRPGVVYRMTDATRPKTFITVLYAIRTWNEPQMMEIMSQVLDVNAPGFKMTKSKDKYKANVWHIDTTQNPQEIPHYTRVNVEKTGKVETLQLLIQGRKSHCPVCKQGVHATRDCPQRNRPSRGDGHDSIREYVNQVRRTEEKEERIARDLELARLENDMRREGGKISEQDMPQEEIHKDDGSGQEEREDVRKVNEDEGRSDRVTEEDDQENAGGSESSSVEEEPEESEGEKGTQIVTENMLKKRRARANKKQRKENGRRERKQREQEQLLTIWDPTEVEGEVALSPSRPQEAVTQVDLQALPHADQDPPATPTPSKKRPGSTLNSTICGNSDKIMRISDSPDLGSDLDLSNITNQSSDKTNESFESNISDSYHSARNAGEEQHHGRTDQNSNA